MLSPLKEKPILFVSYLILTAMVCGALVMAVEVMGSRVISPFYGVSLFVWTSLITVTLVALALGYAAGRNNLRQKRNARLSLWNYPCSRFIGCFNTSPEGDNSKSFLHLGLRSGALVSSMLLFGPVLFLLGCVSPYIIKIAAKEIKNIGRTVGLFYAVSTIGSFLGTVLTGFILIAYLGVNLIFGIIGVVLICLSVIYFLIFRKKWYLLILIAIPFSYLIQQI